MKYLSLIILSICFTANSIWIISCEKPQREVLVETGQVTEIMLTSAKVSGEIIDIGEGISEHGHCWSKGTTPTTNDSHTTLGSISKPGSYTSELQNLVTGEIYYVRAYAVSKGEIIYGNEVTFITLTPPTATTNEATNISVTTATLNGTVNANGQNTIVTFEYGITTSYGSTITANQSPVTGSTNTSVSAVITGLNLNTSYHFRVKALSAAGQTNGGNQSFKTPLTTTFTDIEGNVYNMVVIGTQVWMQENLKVTKYNDGTAIPLVTDNIAWSNLTTPGYCWYKNDASTYKAAYGALYNWYTINTGKLCPIGWHVPTDAEWTTLTTFLGGENVAGVTMKETGTTHWISPNTGANNESGFTGLPGGNRGSYGSFVNIGYSGYWWSSSEYLSSYAWYWFLDYNHALIYRNYCDKDIGFSVRCLKD